MKFVAERTALLSALSLAARLAARRDTIPILNHVKLSAAKGNVVVTGTNMDRVGSADAAAAIGKSGATTANAHLLLAFVKNAVDGSQVEVELTNAERLVVRAGRARADFPTLPASEFPDISEGKFDSEFAVEAEPFGRALGFVDHAMANDKDRTYLNGVYLHHMDGRLVFVACDGFSLARIALDAAKPVGEFAAPIIPREAIDDLKSLAGESKDGALRVEISDTRLRVSAPGRRLSTKLVDGTYPNYERIIPAENKFGFAANRVDLEAAAGRCGFAADGKDRTLKLSMDKNVLTLSARNDDSGEVTDEIDVQARGEGITAVHVVRLAQALSALGSAEIDCAFGDGTPITLRDPTDPDVLQLVGSQKVAT